MYPVKTIKPFWSREDLNTIDPLPGFMIITISGTTGSGKSTIAKLLASRLGLKHHSIGDLSRIIAEKKGMTIEEFNAWGITHPERDKMVDEYQVTLGRSEDDFIIDGRLSFHFIPQSIKIYIDADPIVRARRRLQDPRKTEQYASLEEAIGKIKTRDEMDRKRYVERYHLDPFDSSFYDIVIDSSKTLPEKIIDMIVAFLHKSKIPCEDTHIIKIINPKCLMRI